MSVLSEKGELWIEEGLENFDLDRVHGWLSEQAYWSPGVSKVTVEKAFKNSLCFSAFHGSKGQVGVARVITDGATFSYLADVFVDNSVRGQGVGKMLMDAVVAHPELQGLRRQMLATHDAHKLYEKYGYSELERPEILMEKMPKDTG